MNKFLTFLTFLLFSCKTPIVETVSNDTVSDTVSDRSWETWDTCSQIPGDHPCNFKLGDKDNEEVELYDFYDKVIVVDLSAMWCGVCQNIASQGEILTQEFGEENFVWITILVEDESGMAPDQNDLKRWVDLYGITGPVLGGDRSLIDMSGQNGYPVSGWPTLVVISREMVLKNGINGWSESLIRSWVEDELK